MSAHGKESAEAGAAAEGAAAEGAADKGAADKRAANAGAVDDTHYVMEQRVPETLRSHNSCHVPWNWSKKPGDGSPAVRHDPTISIVCLQLNVRLHPVLFQSPHNAESWRYGKFPTGVYTFQVLPCIDEADNLYVVKVPLDNADHLNALRREFALSARMASADDEMKKDALCFAVNHEGVMRWQQEDKNFQLRRPVGVSRYGGPPLSQSLGRIAQIPNVIEKYQNFVILAMNLLWRFGIIHDDLHSNNVAVRTDADGKIQFTVLDFGLSQQLRKVTQTIGEESGRKRVSEEAFDDVRERPGFAPKRCVHGFPPHFKCPPDCRCSEKQPDEVRFVIIWIALMWVVNARSVSGGAGAPGAAGGAAGAARMYLLFGQNGRQLQVKDLSTPTRAMKAMRRTKWKPTHNCAQCRECNVPTARCSCCMQELCRDKCMQNEETDSGDFFCIECSTATCNNPSCPSNPCTPLPADQEVAVVQASTNKLPCQLCFKWTCCLRDGKCVQCV
tara:strand:- start:888 stop:2390 length:1503 start_codon:yes stop_codon:yes gene_type:complete